MEDEMKGSISPKRKRFPFFIQSQSLFTNIYLKQQFIQLTSTINQSHPKYIIRLIRDTIEDLMPSTQLENKKQSQGKINRRRVSEKHHLLRKYIDFIKQKTIVFVLNTQCLQLFLILINFFSNEIHFKKPFLGKTDWVIDILKFETKSIFFFLSPRVRILKNNYFMTTQIDQKHFLEANKKSRFREGLMDPFIASSIPKDAKTILDLGCGAAQYHELILKQNPSVTQIIGVDQSEKMLKAVKKVERTKYLLFDVTKQIQQQKVDCIIASFLIQHFRTVQALQAFIINCKKQLKEHGSIIIFSIDTNKLVKSQAFGKAIRYKVIMKNEDLKDGQQFIVKVKAWENQDTHWSPQFLVKKFSEQGLSAEIREINTDIISKTHYSQDEIRQVKQSKSVYHLVAFQK